MSLVGLESEVIALIAVVYCQRSTAEVQAYLVVWDVVWLSWVFLQRVAWSGRPAEISAHYPFTWLLYCRTQPSVVVTFVLGVCSCVLLPAPPAHVSFRSMSAHQLTA